MSDFIEKLNLAEKAAEDIYFAKVNRELIEALHRQMEAGKEPVDPSARFSDNACADDGPVVMQETAKTV
jgi:hypothetical protein